MQEKIKREITLSIETAVHGGSISILEDGNEIDFWTGDANISRAEEVLEVIRRLLGKKFVTRELIKLIAVSAGPGSATGIKIGLSTAKGLARAFNCRLVEVSVLDALLSKAETELKEIILTAVPIGKNLIAWRAGRTISSETQITGFEEFSAEMKSGKYSQSVLHGSIFRLFSNSSDVPVQKVINAGDNIAELIGKIRF